MSMKKVKKDKAIILLKRLEDIWNNLIYLNDFVDSQIVNLGATIDKLKEILRRGE